MSEAGDQGRVAAPGVAVNALRLASIVVVTILLGSAAILACLTVPGGRAFTPLARFWARLLLRIARVEAHARRHPAVDASRPGVYVANHQSQFDIPALIAAMPGDFRMVAKRELLMIPIFGWALWLAGFVFVDRRDRQSAIRSLERAAETFRRGTSIVVFAEGTRSSDGRLLPFKKGGFMLALQAGVPIVPVSIRGGSQVLPKGALRIVPGRIDVAFGEPVDTSLFTIETRDALVETVRRRIVAGLDLAAANPVPGSVPS